MRHATPHSFLRESKNARSKHSGSADLTIVRERECRKQTIGMLSTTLFGPSSVRKEKYRCRYFRHLIKIVNQMLGPIAFMPGGYLNCVIKIKQSFCCHYDGYIFYQFRM